MNHSNEDKRENCRNKRSEKDRRVADDNIMLGTDMRSGKDRRKIKAEKCEPKTARND